VPPDARVYAVDQFINSPVYEEVIRDLRNSPPANKAMPFSLPSDHVLLNRQFGSKRDVIQVIGDVMVRSADVSPVMPAPCSRRGPVQHLGSRRRALPHGTNQAKKEVLRNSIVFVQIPKGVDWGDGKTVHLANRHGGNRRRTTLAVAGRAGRGIAAAGKHRAAAFVNSSQEVIGMLTAGRRPGGRVMQAAILYAPNESATSKSAPCRRSRPRRCFSKWPPAPSAAATSGPSASAPANITEPVTMGHETGGRHRGSGSRGRRLLGRAEGDGGSSGPCGECPYAARGIQTMCDKPPFHRGTSFTEGFADT